MTESIHSHIIGVTFGVTLFLFRFCHDFTDYFSKLLIGQCNIVTIIVVNGSFEHIPKLFILWGGHARSLLCHVNYVQNILTTFEYVKLAQHFICNQRFLIFSLIIYVFLFVNIFLNTFLFVFLRRTFVDDDSFLFVLVRTTDL